jgi:hypothetical protein
MRFLWLVVCALALSGQVSSRLSTTDWAGIRGVNYIPSYGRNLYEIWRGYNHDAFDSELALAQSVGYNSVRIWLNFFAYAENPQSFVKNLADAAALCRRHDLRAVFVLFDSCGIRARKDARLMRVEDAYRAFLASPRLPQKERDRVRTFYKPYAEGLGRDVLIPVGADTPPEIIIWQYWQQNPGFDKLDESWWPKLDQYALGVVSTLANNERVLAWDLMNEPEFASEDPFNHGLTDPAVREKMERFLRHERDVIKRKYPNELVTYGFAALDLTAHYADLADVLTFHIYGDPDKLRSTIEKAKGVGKKYGKPIFITETLANFKYPPYDIAEMATDQGQLEHYRKDLPVLLESKIGWMAWGLVIGRVFDSYTDIFYANGQARPAAIYLREALEHAK